MSEERVNIKYLLELIGKEKMEYHRRGMIPLPSKYIDGYNTALDDIIKLIKRDSAEAEAFNNQAEADSHN